MTHPPTGMLSKFSIVEKSMPTPHFENVYGSVRATYTLTSKIVNLQDISSRRNQLPSPIDAKESQFEHLYG